MQKLFPNDRMSKRERVEATLNHQPVDRAALHDELSYNAGVLALYTGQRISGFDYTLADIGLAIQRSLDMCFAPHAPVGTQRVEQGGWVRQNDNWTSWLVSRPFADVEGARSWLEGKIEALRRQTLPRRPAAGQVATWQPTWDAEQTRADYRRRYSRLLQDPAHRRLRRAFPVFFSNLAYC